MKLVGCPICNDWEGCNSRAGIARFVVSAICGDYADAS